MTIATMPLPRRVRLSLSALSAAFDRPQHSGALQIFIVRARCGWLRIRNKIRHGDRPKKPGMKDIATDMAQVAAGRQKSARPVTDRAHGSPSSAPRHPNAHARGHSTAVPPTSGAISPEQLQLIAAARDRSRKITRAAGTAAFSGWTMAFFGAVSLLTGLFSPPGFLLGVGLCIVAVIELRGSKGLRAFDLAAPRRLAFNQLAVFIVVGAYAGWGIVHALVGPSPYAAHLAAGGQVAEAIAPIDRLTTLITVAFYAAVIGGSAILQGGAAVYYLTRRGHMLTYLQRTPKWVVDALRTASA